MYGMDAAIQSLNMRGIYQPTSEQICAECNRMLAIYYHDGKTGFRKRIVGISGTTEEENRVKWMIDFMTRNFEDDCMKCAMFKEGDLLQCDIGTWKYGIVKGIEKEYDGYWMLKVSVSKGRTEKVYAGKLMNGVSLADLPPEIMELAKSQVASKCPLMNGEC